MSSQEEIWSDLEAFALDHFTLPSFNAWFRQAKLEGIDLDKKKIYISVPSDIVKERWIDELEFKLVEFTYKHLGQDLTPEYLLPDSHYQTTDSLPKQTNQPTLSSTTGNVQGTPLNASYTFENFVEGPNNSFAKAGAIAICDDLGTLYNPFIIHGGTGLGKTHLMHAIGHEVLKKNADIKIMNVSCEKFMNDYITAIRKKGDDPAAMDKFRALYRNVDLLMIDDIQFLENKEGTQVEFFYTFEELTAKDCQIVMTSDRPIDKIPQLQDRLLSRFSYGTSCDVTLPDLETRIAILQEKCELKHLTLPNDTIEYIASTIDSNVRELEGALSQLQLYSSTKKGEVITPTIASHILQNNEDPHKEELSILKIQETVARFYNVTIKDLTGKKRVKKILLPRQVAMYLSRELTDNSLPKIGDAFGGKDHTTVMNACDRIRQHLKNDDRIKSNIQELKNLLLH